jgi:hypothetical protein
MPTYLVSFYIFFSFLFFLFFFLFLCVSASRVRKTPPLPPPERNDAATLWFGEGQTLEEALRGRKAESIRAMGGAVQQRVYGYDFGSWKTILPNLEYADLRKSGWTEIEEHCFRGLKKLSRVELPVGLVRICRCAFWNDPALAEIWFPDTLKELGDYAFDSTGLKEVAFPSGIETLGYSSFDSCYSLRRVELPSAMRHIGESAFRFCSTLETLVVGDVEECEVFSDHTYNALGCGVKLKELRLTGRRWECVPADVIYGLAKGARVIGPNFVGHILERVSGGVKAEM